MDPIEPTWQSDDGSIQLYNADCLDWLRQAEADSIDSIVTDPPAGIGFMGKAWDHDKGGRNQWIAWMQTIAVECLRVLKPGGHALVWALPRTSHWTATAWENAGFEVREIIMHIFGSGFPKSLDVSKAIDKAAGAEREVVGRNPQYCEGRKVGIIGQYSGNDRPWIHDKERAAAFRRDVTAPSTNAAKQWQGWGTALKPAAEHWILLRKPIEGTVAANVQKYGTGGINVDGCRIGTNKNVPASRSTNAGAKDAGWGFGPHPEGTSGFDPNIGRWPANLIHDGSDEVLAGFPEVGLSSGGGGLKKRGVGNGRVCGDYGEQDRPPNVGIGDSGSAARFFYCAKASKEDRDEGCEGLEVHSAGEVTGGRTEGSAGLDCPRAGAGRTNGSRNHHPTVKPTDLMRYLCRLVTPPGGLILDPFMGSGSTGKAAAKENFRFIGIETEPGYFDIAVRRIEAELNRFPLLEPKQPKQGILIG